ncbi:MAG: 7TM diverse intracellular signaling domain-containing protein, partial [Bacteroidota bacterium]
MNKHRLAGFLTFIFLGSVICLGKTPLRDSLMTALTLAPDSLKAPIYERMAGQFDNLEQPDSVRYYSQLAYQYAGAFQDSLTEIYALYNLYFLAIAQEDSNQANRFLQEAYYKRGTFGYTLSREYSNYNNSIVSNLLRACFLIYQDPTHQLRLEDIQRLWTQNQFQPNVPDAFQLEPSTWLRFRIKGHADASEQALFMIGMENVTWDSIWVYLPQVDGSYQEELTGNLVYNKDKHGVSDWRSIFQVDLAPNQEKVVFIRVKGLSVAIKPNTYSIYHLPPNFFTEIIPKRKRDNSIFLGILLAQFFYFLLLSLVTRERTYAPYLLYLIGVISFSLTHLKYHDWFQVWPDYDWITYFICVGVAGFGLISFAMSYLSLKELSPLWYRITQVFRIVFIVPSSYLLLLIILSMAFDRRGGVKWMVDLSSAMIGALFFFITVALIYITWLGIFAWRKGYKPASSYLVGIGILIIFVGITPSLVMLVPAWLIIEMSYESVILFAQTGIVLQLIFFALGVGQKINLLEKSHAEALEEKLESER